MCGKTHHDLSTFLQPRKLRTMYTPLGDAAAWPVAAAIRHFRDEFEWHINNPECLTRNYGIAHYADPLPVVEKQ